MKIGIAITYKHSHECEQKDGLVIDRPETSNGVAMIVRPWCIEAGVELEEVNRETW